MSARRLDQERIESDGRLVLLVQRKRIRMRLAEQVTEMARETDQPMPSPATAAGDPQRLRGVPICGRSVGSTMKGTQPASALGFKYRDDGPEVRSLFVFAQGVDGTSPGTQPEDALIEKETREQRN